MRVRTWVSASVAILLIASVMYGQFRGRRFPRGDDDDAPIPADANEKTEFVFGRLQYLSYRGGAGYWGVRGSWTTDYPKAERHFVQGVRRLTRIHTRSMEQVVNLDADNDEIFNYPWIYGVEVGHWDLTDEQCKKLREYLLRGGFLMVDDFHGSIEWEIFMASLSRVFPDRPVIDIPPNDHIMHILYELDEKVQVPGIVMFYSGQTYEQDGVEPKWRAILDDKNRIMVAICHNMDLGDSWEHADMPEYPEKYTSLGYRIGINYIIYSMTH